MKKQILKSIFFITIFLFLPHFASAATPVLNFSDITSGPKTGNEDGIGSGAIVTIWGNYLGSAQGTSKVYIGDVEATAIYYWKNADGQLPGGPSDLFTYHKMQEIAFAIPAGAPDGATTIKVVIGGIETNTLPFTVRSGNIYFIKSTGNDTSGVGSWSNPWLTLHETLRGGNGKITAGDIVYSVGVGSVSDVNIGAVAEISGIAEAHCALVAYPNTSVILTGGTAANIRNFNTYNKYWSFSKMSATTIYQAFSVFGYSRYIGNKITGPQVGAGYSGWIGGGCGGVADLQGCVVSVSGHKIFGNEIYNYGDATKANVSHHLYYISNRSGLMADSYEIGWNYHHDNPVYQGIHIYDQESCGGWAGIIKVHNNVIKNQGGNAINFNYGCAGDTSSFLIYNNLIIKDVGYSAAGNMYADPVAAIRVALVSGSNVKVYNNTIYGYAAASTLGQGISEFSNNLIYGNQDVAYFDANVPPVRSNNLFYNSANPSLSLPVWASGSLNVDPIFSDSTLYDFSLQSSSPAKIAGSDVVLATTPTDFFGQLRVAGSVSIGAIQYVSSGVDLTPPGAPSGLSVQ